MSRLVSLRPPVDGEHDTDRSVIVDKILALLPDRCPLRIEDDLFIINHDTITTHFSDPAHSCPSYMDESGVGWYYLSSLDDGKIELLMDRERTRFIVLNDGCDI